MSTNECSQPASKSSWDSQDFGDISMVLKMAHFRKSTGPRWVNYYLHFTIYPNCHGPLTRYVKLQVAHAPGMPGTFPSAADFKGNRYLAIPACITARAWRTCRDACRDRLPAVTGKTFPAFPARAHPQFCVSGKRPILRRHHAVKLLASYNHLFWVIEILKRSHSIPILNGYD